MARWCGLGNGNRIGIRKERNDLRVKVHALDAGLPILNTGFLSSTQKSEFDFPRNQRRKHTNANTSPFAAEFSPATPNSITMQLYHETPLSITYSFLSTYKINHQSNPSRKSYSAK